MRIDEAEGDVRLGDPEHVVRDFKRADRARTMPVRRSKGEGRSKDTPGLVEHPQDDEHQHGGYEYR